MAAAADDPWRLRSGRPRYYVREGETVRPAASYGERFEAMRKRAAEVGPDNPPGWIRYDQVGAIGVSTIFLFDDMAIAGPPQLFETLVAGWVGEEPCYRTGTYAAAIAMHEAVVADLSKGARPAPWRCPICCRGSWHQKDLEERFCGVCKSVDDRR